MKQLEFDSLSKAEEFAEILEGANLQAKCVCDVLKIATRDLKKKGESLLPAAALVQILQEAGKKLAAFGESLAETLPPAEAATLSKYDSIGDEIENRLRVVGE